MILAIDPGSEQSAYCMLEPTTFRPMVFDKVDNADLKEIILDPYYQAKISHCVIERVESYGMGVGRTIFDTCIWTGRFLETAETAGIPTGLLPRRDVKMHLCGRTAAKDSNILAALKERFGEKGTKAAPGWFYGFRADIWQAYALGVAWMELGKEDGHE